MPIFTRTSNGDANGMFYYIGTQYGTSTWKNPTLNRSLSITASNIASTTQSNQPSVITERTVTQSGSTWYYSNSSTTPYPWLIFDLGSQILVNEYTIRHPNQTTDYIRNWKLQGSNNKIVWTDLDIRANDTTINASGAWGNFVCNQNIITKFRYIKLTLTGINSSSNNRFYLDEVEFYGEFTPPALDISRLGFNSYLNRDSEITIDTNGIFYKIGTNEGLSAWSNPADGNRVVASQSTNQNLTLIAPKATDRSIASVDSVATTAVQNSWVKWDFGVNKKVSITGFVTSSGVLLGISQFKLQGSNDDTNWIDIGDYSIYGTSQMNYILDSEFRWVDDLNNKSAYRYIRLLQLRTASIILREVELYGYYGNPIVQTINSPASITSSEQTGQPKVFFKPPNMFTRIFDGDQNGILYNIGTSYNTTTFVNPSLGANLTISTSSVLNTSSYPYNVTDRNSTPSATTRWQSINVNNEWIQFDLGSPVSITEYSLRNSYDGNSSPRNWKLQGSNNKTIWTDIDTRINDTTLTGNAVWSAFPCNGDIDNSYRYIRLYQTGLNSSGAYNFCIDEVEFYGFFSPPQINIPSGFNIFNKRKTTGILDTNGIFFKIGTNLGASAWSNPADGTRLNVTSSSITSSTLYATDRSSNALSTSNLQNSWVKFDFGSIKRAVVQGFAYTPPTSLSSYLLNFKFQGSNDDTNWTTIGTYNLNTTFGSNTVFRWVDDPTSSVYYRYFRIYQDTPSANASANDVVSIGEIEFYGFYGTEPKYINGVTSVSSQENFGNPVVQSKTTINYNSIVSQEAIGSNLLIGKYSYISTSAISSEENFGNLNIHTSINLNINSINTSEAIGLVNIAPQAVYINTVSIDSNEQFGFLQIIVGSVVSNLTSISSAEEIGYSVIQVGQVEVNLNSISTSETIGNLSINTNSIINDAGNINSSELFGFPKVIILKTYLNINSINSEENFGDPIIHRSATFINPIGINSQESISQIFITVGSVSINLISINTLESISNLIVNAINNILVSSVYSEEIFNDVTILIGPAFINLESINSDELLGYIQINIGEVYINIESLNSNENISLITVLNKNYVLADFIESDEYIGSIDISVGPVNIFTYPIDSSEIFGYTSIGALLKLISLNTSEEFGQIQFVGFRYNPASITIDEIPITVLKDDFDVTIQIDEIVDVTLIDENDVVVFSSGETYLISDTLI